MHRLFRIQNLFIVAITQYLLQYLVLVPAFGEAGLERSLDHFHFFLLVLTTLIIAAGGYVINDMLDYEADMVNKREKVTVRVSIPARRALLLYFALVAAGAAVAWYLAGYVGQPALFLIYPFSVLLLFLYSYRFKKMPLTGNVVVAFFCAGVAGIVLFAERHALGGLAGADPVTYARLNNIALGYVGFAFLTTLLREQVKDLEDMEGDRAVNLRTLPLVYGTGRARGLAMATAGITAAAMLAAVVWLYRVSEWTALSFAIPGILLPLVLMLRMLARSEEKNHYTRLSNFTKMVMLAGLLLLIILWKF